MKKSIAIITTIIIGITLIALSIIIMMSNKKIIDDNNKVENNKHNYNEEYRKKEEEKNEENTYNLNETYDIEKHEEKMKRLCENETNGIEEKVIIIIRDEEDNEYNITDKDIELFKLLGAQENDTEEKTRKRMVEYKISYIEAQKLGLKLSQKEIDEIEELANYENDLKYIQNNDIARNKFIERQRNYFLQVDYWGMLMRKILNEITENNISIDDEDVNQKMKEYNKNTDEFLAIEEPTEEERMNAVKKNVALANKIINLYLDAIESKYTVEYK